MDARSEVARLLAKWRPVGGAQRKAPKSTGGSHELYREVGENFRSVCVQISGDHFQMDTHDMGRATEEFWGDSDYEFWTVVKKAEWPKLIAAFAQEVGADAWAASPETWHALDGARQASLLLAVAKVLFAGDSRATDRVRDICARHNVEYSGGSWV